MAENRFRCSSCGQEHEGLPLSFAADYPDSYANMSADERDARTVIGSDQCIIDNQDFYIRGCLEIPILGTDEVFMWGLWARIQIKVISELAVYISSMADPVE